MTKQEWIRYLYSEMRYYQPFKVFQGIRREHVEGKERFMKWAVVPLDPQSPFAALDEFMVPKKPSDRRTVAFRIERSLDGKPFGPPRWCVGTIEDFAQMITQTAVLWKPEKKARRKARKQTGIEFVRSWTKVIAGL